MEEKNSLEKTTEHLKNYAEAKIDLIRLDLSDKIVSTVSSISSIMLIGLISIFILLFLSIGAALWITEYFDQASMGFFIVAGFYLVVVIILYITRESLVKVPMINLLLNKFHSDEED